MPQTTNMTQGNPLRLMIRFAIPLMLGNVFLQFAVMMEGSIVGRVLGVDGVAAIGATNGLFSVLRNFAQGLSIGLPVITAQRFGAGETDGVRRSVTSGVYLSLLGWLAVAGVLLPLWRPILAVMNTPAQVMDDAWIYLFLSTAGLGATLLHYFFLNVVRAVGESHAPLAFQVLSAGLDILLAWVFVGVLDLGVAGIPMGQITAQLLGTLLFLLYMGKVRRAPVLQLKREDWRTTRQDFSEHLRSGITSSLMFSIAPCGGIIIQPALNGFGAVVVAGYTATTQITGVFIQAQMAIGQAVSTYVAQNFGAGEYGRIRTGVRQSALAGLALWVAMAAFGILASDPLTRFYMGEVTPELLGYARTNMVITTIGMSLLGLLFIYRQALQALGSRVLPIFASAMEPLARIIAVVLLIPRWGYPALCWSLVLAWAMTLTPLAMGYRTLITRLDRGIV